MLAVLLAVTAMLLDGYWKKHPVSRERKLTFLILAGLCLYASAPLFIQSFKQADDLCYHLLRIEGIKDGMRDGQFPVVIYPEALSGNGYLNSMYPYLFLYIPAFLRLFGVSLAMSYKFLILLANIATVALTWKSFRMMKASRYACLLGTALYILLPYRFTNIYARGALGETLAMTFLPVVIAGFYQVLVGDQKKWIWLVLGFTGLVESHVLSTAYMAVIFAACCLVFVRELFREKRWLSLLKAAGLTVLLNLWFLVPFLYFYLKENLYTESLDWSGYSEYSINAAFLLDTFIQMTIGFCRWGCRCWACGGLCTLDFCGEERRGCGKIHGVEQGKPFSYFFVLDGLCAELPGDRLFWKQKADGAASCAGTCISHHPVSLAASGACGSSVYFRRCRLALPFPGAVSIRKLIFAFLVGVNLLTCLNQPSNENNFSYLEYDDTTTVGIRIRSSASQNRMQP